MQSLWNNQDAAAFVGDDLAMRVYTSRLLGASEDLVMHGGGNTSVKGTASNFFGDEIDVLYVKGSGWDLKTIEKPGFPALRLAETCRLAELETLSDVDMTRQLRSFMLDPTAPSPSVEAILHAIMPFKFVDHTHTDAIVTLTNNPGGEALMADLFPDCLVLPYIMPGFILSRQVLEAIRDIDLGDYRGIILMHHGVFTYSDNAREAYETMIDLVTRAEDYIAAQTQETQPEQSFDIDLEDLARIRRAVSQARGAAQLAMVDASPEAQRYTARSDLDAIAGRGPITPDHVLRTKRIPVILPKEPAPDIPEVARFASDYAAYFDAHTDGELTMLDPAPRVGLWQDTGIIAFGDSTKACGIAADIARHTAWAVQTGEALGGWQALPPSDIFELEYWSLEQAKLGKGGASKPHQGKVALVTGAASGIGLATARSLSADGAAVVGLDINPETATVLAAEGCTGLVCDLTNEVALREAVYDTVRRFGGLDILVCNAGIFPAGEYLDGHSAAAWDETLAVNLTSTQRLLAMAIPFLKLGVDASVLVVGSRNYPAPGPGAAAYSVSKAGLTQLARVAALELAPDGIRVNVVHPDAVFDSGLWTDEALATSAARYGISVEEYKQKNLLKAHISSAQVGELLAALASPLFAATTGAQIPIDGGNDRVI